MGRVSHPGGPPLHPRMFFFSYLRGLTLVSADGNVGHGNRTSSHTFNRALFVFCQLVGPRMPPPSLSASDGGDPFPRARLLDFALARNPSPPFDRRRFAFVSYATEGPRSIRLVQGNGHPLCASSPPSPPSILPLRSPSTGQRIRTPLPLRTMST